MRDHLRRPTAATILSKPILAQRVLKLQEQLHAPVAENDHSSGEDIKRVEAQLKGGAGAGGHKKLAGPYAEEAGK